MALRQGIYGDYYGTLVNESYALTSDQMKTNAIYIYSYLKNKGWTINAIAGMLGNMQAESSLNPGRWQSEDIGNTNLGYGLVQWTPATKYIEWCQARGYDDYSTMDNNLARIIYELENNIQWIPTSEYNFSFETFSKSTEMPSYLASAFLKCYERAGVEVEETRRQNALDWFLYLANNVPNEPVEPENPGSSISFKRKSKFNFILFNRRRKVH